LGLTGDEAPATLSGGEARRAALALVLAPETDVLLLDEPTNHLDLPAIEWLEGALAARRGALVLISHDRRFLQRLSRATVWLDRGVTRRLGRGFAEFEAWRDKLLDEEDEQQRKLARRIVAEEHWLRYGVTARRKRNQNRLARLQGLRAERRDHRHVAGTVRLDAGDGPLSGKLVVEAEGLAKQRGDRTVVRDVSLRLLRGDRLGIVGANGAGKTTLVSLLTGQLAPDAGHVRLGANLAMATLDQHRESLNPDTTLKDALTGGGSDTVEVAGERRHVFGYMKDFLFAPEQARTPVGRLSGGERGRLMLARALARPSNLLVLDEPTNDLDLETLDLLQEMLADYAGTLILVSHDRDFLDRVATALLVAEGDGVWREYAGGYTDMLAQRRAGIEARAPVAPARAPKEAAPAAPEPGRRRPRLSFKEQHALETLPTRIETLRAERARLQTALDDVETLARDLARLSRATVAYAEADAALRQAEEEWLALEIKREELEG
jgi:ATP-binding cassette subfamily F protein uup